MDNSSKLGQNPSKLRFVVRLINIAKKHGLYMSVYDSSAEMEQAVIDMHLGRELRKRQNPNRTGRITITGDFEAAPPNVWPCREHALMFARYVLARRAEGV